MDDGEWLLIDEWSEPDASPRRPQAESVRSIGFRRPFADLEPVADADLRFDTLICCGPEPVARRHRLWVRRSALPGSTPEEASPSDAGH